MTTKKPAAFLAFAGACALALTGPAALASPPTQTDTRPDAGATASSLPVGNIDTALTSKSGETTQDPQAPTTDEVDPAALVTIVVQLDDGADRAASLASINEAVAPEAGWVSESGAAAAAGPVRASAQAPANARNAAGFFVVMCVLQCVDGRPCWRAEGTPSCRPPLSK